MDIISDLNVLLIKNGNFVILPSGNQEGDYLMQATRGQFYFSPLSGVAAKKELNSEGNTTAFRQRIRSQFLADGLVINKLTVMRDGEGEVQVFADLVRTV